MSLSFCRLRGYVTVTGGRFFISLNPISEKSEDFPITLDERDDIESNTLGLIEIDFIEYGSRLLFG